MKKQVVAATIAFLMSSAAVQAQNYPSGPITLLQGYAPGGSADTIARLIAEPLSKSLDVAVVVEPKPGAGGILAASTVARANPDGYTIGLITGGHTLAKGLYASLPFDPVDDFSMITNVVEYNFVLAVPAGSTARTLGDLLAQAKADPGSIGYGSAGVGTTHHLTGELLASTAGVTLVHIPYGGETAAVGGILGGEINMIIASPVTLAPQIRAGKLRALAVTSDRRWSGLPEVPTVAEAGVAGFNVSTWAGLVAPKGVPEPIITRLRDETLKLLAIPKMREKVEASVGGVVQTSTPEEMRHRIAEQTTYWIEVVESAGIERQ